VGNSDRPNQLYRNENGVLTATPVWTPTETTLTWSLAWGDVDNDGDLDLATGNRGQPNRLYRNDNGSLTTAPVWSSIEFDATESVAWGDADGDGDLDLAAGNFGQPNRLYRNDNGTLTRAAAWLSVSNEVNQARSLAWGDVNGDGNLDLMAGGAGSPIFGIPNLALYHTQTPAHPFHPNQAASVALDLYSNPVSTFNQMVTALAPANFYATPGIRGASTIPISYTITNPPPDLTQLWRVRGFFSPNGGGRWFPAVATGNTITRNVSGNVAQLYQWDVGASGFFGASDNLVFRLEALPVERLPPYSPYVTARRPNFRGPTGRGN
jgi:hypothetical protein